MVEKRETAIDVARDNVEFFVEHIESEDARHGLKMAVHELMDEMERDTQRRILLTHRRYQLPRFKK
jgi:hypothetical protein